MCFTSLQLSSRIFWIGIKFHSNSCRCSDSWLTEQPELTVILAQNSYFSSSWLNFFSVHQINHFPVACCKCNLPHNLLGQWFIWWMVLLIQSSFSSLQHCISTDNHNYLIWAPLHSACTCERIHCTPVWWLTFSTFCMITSYSILYVNKN